ncbi:MAG: helix-turn-helix transcriptional regulator [Gammaproteobacteria bacterium]
MQNLASVLTHLMTEKNIGSAELARKTGVAQPVIYRLMTGETVNPQIQTLMPLTIFFGISVEQLVGVLPLRNQNVLSEVLLHNINTKLSTVKTIASVLVDLMPGLTEGYQKALAANMIDEMVPADVLPLLTLNSTILLKTTNQIQELILNNDKQ